MKTEGDFRQRSIEIARKAIPFMSEHDIPITPQNYLVWYEYFLGRMAELHATLKELLGSGANFDDTLNIKIYKRFFERNQSEEEQAKLVQEMKVLEKVQADADNLLIPISKELDGLSSSNKSYSDKLSNFSGQIKGDPENRNITSIMDSLVEETEKIAKENEAVSSDIISSAKQLKELRLTLAKAKEEARIDDLTKINNRRAFNEKIEEETRRVEKENETSSLALIDIDKFKNINDQYGHPTGDKALQAIAIDISEKINHGDEVFRFGGEEFAVIFKDASIDRAVKYANTVRVAIADHEFAIRGALEQITISAGVSKIEPGRSIEEILKLADEALYLAKNSGRNNVKSEIDLKAANVKGA